MGWIWASNVKVKRKSPQTPPPPGIREVRAGSPFPLSQRGWEGRVWCSGWGWRSCLWRFMWCLSNQWRYTDMNEVIVVRLSKIFYITCFIKRRNKLTNSHETFAIAMVQTMQPLRLVNDIFWAIIAVTRGEQNEWSAAARVSVDFFLAYLLSFVWAHF